MNYSLILKQMQMAYLGERLEQESEGERCSLCWEKQCNHTIDIKNDPFISLTTVGEFKYA